MTDNTAAHKRERRKWKAIVDAGNGWCSERVCLMPTRWLDPAEPFDLAHDHVNGGYLGPAHFAATGRRAPPRGNRARHRGTPPPPKRWVL